MKYTILNISDLHKLLESKSHSRGMVAEILPFTVNLNKNIEIIGQNFRTVMGEFVRKICNLKLPETKDTDGDDLLESDRIIEKVMQQIHFEPEEQPNLKRILKQFIYNNQNYVNLFHPFMFTLINTPNKSEFRNFAQFLSDILIQNNNDIKRIFLSKNTDNLLSDLILNNLDVIELENSKYVYQPLLDELTKKYQEDLMYISKNNEFFLKNFELLTHFYIFMYICQLFIKFEGFEKGDFSKLTPLTFALDWEPMTKRREAIDPYSGYRRISNNYHKLFVHIHTMSQLSNNSICNPINQPKQKMRFFHYKEIYDIFSAESSAIKDQFITDVNNWMEIYANIFNEKNITPKPKALSLEDAFRNLFYSISEGVSFEAATKFGRHIERLAGSTFLKSRGRYGYILNMTHNMLILLTAVCVKDERIPLKELFQRFKERGVNFDRLSKKEIIQLLDSNNIIDKKSDSGDAQYVKPIL